MARITITVPDKIRAKAERQAKRRGVSLGDFLREVLTSALNGHKITERSKDPLFADDAVYDGPVPPDLAANHDKYLYGEMGDLH